jgi:hypothetical protein
LRISTSVEIVGITFEKAFAIAVMTISPDWSDPADRGQGRSQADFMPDQKRFRLCFKMVSSDVDNPKKLGIEA